ncbi:MAG: type II secretion system protein GspD [Opitutales bacterium]
MSLAATLAWFGAFAYGADQQTAAEHVLPPEWEAQVSRGPSLEDQMAAANAAAQPAAEGNANDLIEGFLDENAAIHSVDELDESADTGAAASLIDQFLAENAVGDVVVDVSAETSGDAGDVVTVSPLNDDLALDTPDDTQPRIVIGDLEVTDINGASTQDPLFETSAEDDIVVIEDFELELDDDALVVESTPEPASAETSGFDTSAYNSFVVAEEEIATDGDLELIDIDAEPVEIASEPIATTEPIEIADVNAEDLAEEIEFIAVDDLGESETFAEPTQPVEKDFAWVDAAGETNIAEETELSDDVWIDEADSFASDDSESLEDGFVAIVGDVDGSSEAAEVTEIKEVTELVETVDVDESSYLDRTESADPEAFDDSFAEASFEPAEEAPIETTDVEDPFEVAETVEEPAEFVDTDASDGAFVSFPVDEGTGGGEFVSIEDDGSVVPLDGLTSVDDEYLLDDTANTVSIDAIDLDALGDDADTVSFDESGVDGLNTFDVDGDSGVSPAFDIDGAATTEISEISAVDVEMPSLAEIDLDYGDSIAPEPGGASPGSVEDDVIDLVDFPDQEIRAIIRDVADLFDLNVVIPDSLVGRTSLKLREVTWRQVFQVVLEPAGFTYIEDGNIIKIKSVNELEREPVATRVYLINFADASSLQGSLTPLIETAAGGRIQVARRTNALIITERPSRMNDIQEVIERLDRPTAQVMIEAKFIDVSDTNDKNLGLDWSSIDNIEIGNFDGLYQASDGAGPDGVFSAAPTGALTTVMSAPEFNVVLRALKRNNNARLISNPTVVAMNNTRALINISEEFPIPEFTFNEERGTFEVSGFEYRPIGILLDVLPQVNSAGFINLTIIPEISSTEESVNFSGGSGTSTEIPIIDTRKTDTTVILKDGYTLAIGGLMEDRESSLTRKLPIFGDIPLAGRLFRADEVSRTKRNLIIFVTARTLNPDGTSYEEIIDPRRLYEMGVDERDIPGYTIPEEERAVYEELRRLRSEMRAREAHQRIEAELAVEAGFTSVADEDLDEDGDAISSSGYQRGFGVRR